MKEKIKNLLFYAGVDQKEYEEVVQARKNKDNRVMVNALSFLATVLISTMFISALFVNGIRMNQIVYGIGAIVSLSLFLTSVFFAKKYDFLTTPLVHIAYFIFYVYGILIGTITDPSQKTVTFMVMLVFLPVLFVNRPFNLIFSTSIYIAVFIALCFKHKTGEILGNDVIDAIVFGILGIATGIIITRIKVKSYSLESQLKKVSRIDKLTEMNNRNAYELDLYTIPEKCQRSLACVYLDANGLKKLNDERGHKYGDELLKCIAKNVVDVFGNKFTYRLGGDEFIAFAPDCNDVEAKVSDLVTNIEANGYQISVGWETHELGHLSLTSLTNKAEKMMYKKKAEFYRNSKDDRRSSKA